MPSIFSVKSPDYKKIFIYSDSSTVNTDYPVLVHYIDGQMYNVYTYEGSSYTIDGEEYNQSSDAQELEFVSTSTVWGQLYAFEINTFVTGVTNSSNLEELINGIHSFLLLSENSALTFIEQGQHIKKDLDCCIAKKIDKSNNSKECDLNTALEDVKKVFAINESIESSLREKEFVNAIQKRKLNITICNSNCKCGCK